MRLAAYAGASVVLATGVFLKALHQRSNFYSACVYLSQSSANLMILTNLCLLITGFVLFWLQRLLYGPLRPIETEQLYERAWFAVTETCLAMTIFRGELGGWFLVMFISLLVGKVWGWIGEGRVEFLEQQPPANPRLFHARLATSLVLTVSFDAFMLRYCVHTVVTKARPDMMVMFGFEFAILAVLSTSTLLRYVIALTEIYITRQQINAKMQERRDEIRVARVEAIREHARAGATSPPDNLPDENDVNEMEIDVPGWEEKGRWIFYLDLLTDLLKLVIYLSFFGILLTFYGLPIHILRDVVVTIRSFARRIMDFMRYRNATRDMHQRYPDATAEEVSREDVCIICREEMIPVQPAQPQPAANAANDAEEPAPQPTAGMPRVPDRLRPKKLPCGHILHFSCLRSWLERQQNCPTCRRPVVLPQRTRGAAGVGDNNARGGQNGGIQPGQQGADAQPRARVYQFGPFRIGFGAVRGDLFNNLQPQGHQGNVPQPGAHLPANAPGGHIGFGFGFGRRPQAPTPAPAPQAVAPGGSMTAEINEQLLQIEQRLNQEIATLRAATEHLSHVRQLQVELERLLAQARAVNQQGAAQPRVGQPAPLPNVTPGSSVFTTGHQYGANPGADALNSGDPRLPEGLTLPPGWTLLPLQRLDNGANGLEQTLQPTPTTTVTSPAAPAVASVVTPQAPTFQMPVQNQPIRNVGVNAHGTTITETPPVNGASNLPISQATSTVPSAEHRAESPSQEWTDVAPRGSVEVRPASSIPTTWGSNGESVTSASGQSETHFESASNGKGRAASVEETPDEEA
ncbi:RING finger protein [Penicillium digitatum]|uniref:RING-type E3 ubiquitin transferase n=3 Tax=Penicillium digitatum TaxID=36651 RepID=K9GZE6_PEND2|nr:RING finger protein [Penicillium digitatum Pd1]EKV20013.1 RING finger protein [Penicillium digitatum PHI26]EKV21852.1 RING finger protein [Penicillium digitatum Pd1]QQK47694.1 RING finger protein [Penicillium digitatum]